VAGSVTGAGSLFRVHPTARAMVDYRSTWQEPPEAERLARMVRYLLDHGVLISPTGLGCVSTAMGDAELESFLEVFYQAVKHTQTA
jgi:glutamate-1-semialdehyde 2,1-aminomutase